MKRVIQKTPRERQAEVWDKEYTQRGFMSGTKPQKSLIRFAKILKKERRQHKVSQEAPSSFGVFDGLRVLDLGCGEGKNALYFAERGAEVIGVDVSAVAVAAAKSAAREADLGSVTDFTVDSMGEEAAYAKFADQSFNIVLDVTSSNALNPQERGVYLQEVHRILKKGGRLFVRALCKDGDTHAKTLLKTSPSHEKDMYIMPLSGLTERVFSHDDILTVYSEYFNIAKIEKETHYTTMQVKNGTSRKFKRNFWILYLSK